MSSGSGAGRVRVRRPIDVQAIAHGNALDLVVGVRGLRLGPAAQHLHTERLRVRADDEQSCDRRGAALRVANAASTPSTRTTVCIVSAGTPGACAVIRAM